MAFKLSLSDYLMKRDSQYTLTQDVREAASQLIIKINVLLEQLETDGVTLEVNPKTHSYINSGWRPLEFNATVPNAAPKSKHITGHAIDIYDPEGEIDEYLMNHLNLLADLDLWMEHPSATKGWCHLQSVPPRSRNRVFYP